MIAKIQELLEEVEKLKASNLEEVEALRIKYLSKKGSLNALMADFRNVPAEMKKEVGMKLNDLKAKAQEKIAALKEAVDTQDCGTGELDLTRTAYPVSLGTRHPLTIVKNEIVDIFSRLGFTLAEGPEIEARVFVDELRRRPSCPRHARHLLRRGSSGHRAPFAHVLRTGPCHGKPAASHPRDLSGTRVPQ